MLTCGVFCGRLWTFADSRIRRLSWVAGRLAVEVAVGRVSVELVTAGAVAVELAAAGRLAVQLAAAGRMVVLSDLDLLGLRV